MSADLSEKIFSKTAYELKKGAKNET